MLRLAITTGFLLLSACLIQKGQVADLCYSAVLNDLIFEDGYSLFRIKEDQLGSDEIKWKIGLVEDCLLGEGTEDPFRVLDKYKKFEKIEIKALSERLENIELVPISKEYLSQINSRTKLTELLMKHDLDAFVLLFRPMNGNSDSISVISHTFWTGNSFTVRHTLMKSEKNCTVYKSNIMR